MRLSLFLYSIFASLFTLFTYLFVDPNLIYFERLYSGIYLANREFVTIIFILFVVGFFAFYKYFYDHVTKNYLKKILFITTAILIFSLPIFLSFDIFNYLFTAKIFFLYGENPYIIMPIEFISDPYLNFTHAANKLALYGVSWVGLTGIPHFLGFGNFFLTLLSFKLFVVLFYFGLVYLIYKISNNIKIVAFFALNPLVLIETFMSGHNDVVMMFFALSSIYFLKKDKFILAIILILLSIFIKYSTIFLLPVFLYYFYKRIRKENIDWDKMFLGSALLMFAIFILSALRVEIYPWYAIWFLPFVALIPKHKFIRDISLILSFTLLLRYVPYMYLGTHFGVTPLIKILITFVPVLILCLYYVYIERKKINKYLLRIKV